MENISPVLRDGKAMVHVNSFFSSAFARQSLDKLFQGVQGTTQTDSLQGAARRISAGIPKTGGFESLDLRTTGFQKDAIARIQTSLSVIESLTGYKATASERTSYLSGLSVVRSEAHARKVGGDISSLFELGIGGTQLADQLRLFATGPRDVSVATSAGNDTIFLIAKAVSGIDAGWGGDDIQVNATTVSGVHARGDADRVMVLAQAASGVHGGAGSDSISVMAQSVNGVYGDNAEGDGVSELDRLLAALPGQANDVITISAKTVDTVDAGVGNDVLSISASESLDGVEGGAGNDMISIVAGEARNVSGGAGDDRLMVTARKADGIRGGTGDDTITLLGKEEASVHFAKGDGRDVVNISGATTITLGAGLSAENATILREGNALKIAFADSTDQITVFLGFADFDDEGPSVEVTGDNTIRIG